MVFVGAAALSTAASAAIVARLSFILTWLGVKVLRRATRLRADDYGHVWHSLKGPWVWQCSNCQSQCHPNSS
ncbi:hypothetical protein V8F06_011903 [Rhypophila decipiens]